MPKYINLQLTPIVPILIQPEDWMQLAEAIADAITGSTVVPILIQPEDWMQ